MTFLCTVLVLVDGRATDNNIIWKAPTAMKVEAKNGKEHKEDEPTRMARKFTRKVHRFIYTAIVLTKVTELPGILIGCIFRYFRLTYEKLLHDCL
jgi:hypothetical protein